MGQPFRALGSKVIEYNGLETFPKPSHTSVVVLVSDEVTAVCPITGQPDWYKVTVEYDPSALCIESKTFKLLLHSLRNQGMFCESLADYILGEVVKYAVPSRAQVTIEQKPRGGVSIVSTSVHEKTPEG